MADDGRATGARPGSVADETARLLDALLGSSAAGATESPEPDPPPDGENAPPASGPESSATGHTHVCGSCGETVPAPAAEVCHLCPVCQLLRVVRQVRPETVDRLADLAAALTETLRDVAATRWAETAPEGGTAADRHRSRVEDIDLGAEDEDDGFDLDDVEDLQLDEPDDAGGPHPGATPEKEKPS